MEADINIVELEPKDWARYKALRLEALQNTPSAFGTSYDEAVRDSDADWMERLQKAQNKDGQWLLFAEASGELVGMIGAYAEKLEKMRHRANIIAVYVKSQMRGKGIARALTEAILGQINNDPNIIAVDLDVTAGNTAAEELYKSLGFREIGYKEKEMRIGDVFYDTRMMSKFIR